MVGTEEEREALWRMAQPAYLEDLHRLAAADAALPDAGTSHGWALALLTDDLDRDAAGRGAALAAWASAAREELLAKIAAGDAVTGGLAAVAANIPR